jgi:biopolymer transport protein TolR
MAFQVDKRRYTGALADINVTPLVDVVLVLLIIFMIAAPVVLQGLQTDLPKAIVSDMEIDSNQLVVTITLNKLTYINNDPVNREDFVEELRSKMSGAEHEFVYLRADKSLQYGDVVRIIEMIKEAGVPNLGIVTEQGREEEE